MESVDLGNFWLLYQCMLGISSMKFQHSLITLLCSNYKIMIVLMYLTFWSLDIVTVIKVTIDEALRANQQSSKFLKKSSLNQFLP